VVEVVDGDTVRVDIDGKLYSVRYIGMDAPETRIPEQPAEPCGPEASAKNAELVAGKTVRLEKDVSEADRYGRLLRYVWVGDVMLNAELVRLGFTRVSTSPPTSSTRTCF
jgi:micrococcal nuclease